MDSSAPPSRGGSSHPFPGIAIEIDPKDAEKYGVPEVEILASTSKTCLDQFPHPTWQLRKRCSTVQNSGFEEVYSNELQEPILAIVKQATSAWKQIHVIRLGFKLEEDPIVTLILVKKLSLSRRSAQAVASEIHAKILSQWSGEE